jgi:peptidoglycan L-alanyl-D-glutamate endopeptidase CwlK
MLMEIVMYKFSKTSLKRKAECHPDLQKILDMAIKEYDFTILCGYRGEVEQNKAFAEKKSKLKYPNSKHNKKPSLAFDVAPYPIDWNNIGRFIELSMVIKRCAKEAGIKLTWGGDWRTFKDYPHYELNI